MTGGRSLPVPLLGGLFFAWGLTSVAVDLAIPHLKAVFGATYAQALLVQSAYFLAYAVLGRASGSLAARLGTGRMAALGLGVMALGCASVAMATLTGRFAPILGATFLIACGVTFLQVSANPLAAGAGSPDRTAARLTWLQSLNSVGTLTAPLLGAVLIYGGAEDGAASLAPIRRSFGSLALVLALLGVLAWRRRPALPVRPAASARPSSLPPRVFFGAGAIFLYVGAEVSIGSTLINLLERGDVLAVPRAAAASLVSFYWGGALTGRLVGAALMPRLGAARLLCGCAGAAGLLAVGVWSLPGPFCAAAALGIGLFNGIQFPSVFALSLAGLAEWERPVAAGWLCTAIVGGGAVPLVFGVAADAYGLRTAYLVPALCYAVVTLIARAYLSPHGGSAAGSTSETALSENP